jgi:hypothetical protein
MIGEALVPYYRQILPVFNMFKNKRRTFLIMKLILEIRLIMHKERIKIYLNWSNKHYRFWKNMEAKTPTSTLSIWYLHMRVACFDKFVILIIILSIPIHHHPSSFIIVYKWSFNKYRLMSIYSGFATRLQ